MSITSRVISSVVTGVRTGLISAGAGDLVLDLIKNGAIGRFVDYTREGEATASDPSGSPVTVAQDIPPYEYDGSGDKLFRQSYGTDNPGTTSLQINDIETGAYEFNGTSDNITIDNPVTLGTTDFVFTVKIRIATVAEYGLLGQAEDGALVLRVLADGRVAVSYSGISVIYASTTVVSPLTDTTIVYNRVYGGTSTLSINGVSESFTDSTNYYGASGFLFSRLNTLFFSGASWYVSLVVDSIINFEYGLYQYRRDTFIPDESGNGNHGTSVRNVGLMLVENQGFGVSGEDARKPFTYTYADGGMFMGGLRELFYGAADGADLTSIIDFGEWNSLGGVSAKTSDSFATTGSGGVWIDIPGITVGKMYCISITGDTTASEITVQNDNACCVNQILLGFGEVNFTAATSKIYIRNEGAGVSSNIIVSIREVSPSIGTILFKSLTLHDTSTDVTLLEGQNGTAVVWFDSATSKIKITDGTNTAESANTVTQGVNIPELRIVLNETEMWITDSTQGTKVTFVGYLPELGNRVLAVSDNEYSTVEAVQALSEVEKENVTYNGELVTYNGEVVYKNI